MGGKALVLGGGGVTGVAWELGILAGLAEAGIDLTTADLVVGTSAGSVVGAIVTSGEPIGMAYERQLAPATAEKAARIGVGVLLRWAGVALTRDEQQARARVGAMALARATIPEQERRAVIAARLEGKDWPRMPSPTHSAALPEPPPMHGLARPTQRLLVTAVAADDGEFVAFDAGSGVSLVDAVSASCAVPGVWSPTTVNGRRYIDGGTRSPANVDLAEGCDAVVVLAPVTVAFRRSMRATAQLAALPPGTRRVLVTPDGDARRAIGRNVLDPARRAASAQAGKAQAARVAQAVRSVWDASPRE